MASNNIKDALKKYIRNRSAENKTDVENLLWYEIFHAIKGQKHSKSIYNLLYRAYSPDAVPDSVERFGIEKPFPLEELYKKLVLKIETKDIKTLTALTGSKEDRVKWIKSTLGLVLNNETFKQENRDHKKKRKEVERGIKKTFDGKSFPNIDTMIKFIGQSFGDEVYAILDEEFNSVEIACWFLSYTSLSTDGIIKWIEANLNRSVSGTQIQDNKKRLERKLMPFLLKKDIIAIPFHENNYGEDGQFHKNPLEDKIVQDYWLNHNEQLKDKIDVIDWQKRAFFWKPGELFSTYICYTRKDMELRDEKGEPIRKAMYIAFFYSWLRKCSYAIAEEIGKEVGVNKSSVGRWEPQHPELKSPFPEEKGLFHPVYFNDASRSSIGMYEAIRCYSKNDYHGAEYAPVLLIKEILWSVYDLLRDSDKLDEFEISKMAEGTFEGKNFRFSYEMKSNEDIGIHLEKKVYFLVYIKSVEVR